MRPPADTAAPALPQEVFLTSHHLGIAMEYADGGDLSQYIDDQSQQGVRNHRSFTMHFSCCGVSGQ